MNLASKVIVSVTALIIVTSSYSYMSKDTKDIKDSEFRNYCSDVELWNKYSNPIEAQNNARDQGALNPVGHPDYNNIYDTECVDLVK